MIHGFLFCYQGIYKYQLAKALHVNLYVFIYPRGLYAPLSETLVSDK